MDFVFEPDSDGKDYVVLQRDFISKNCPGGIGGREFESSGRIQDFRQVQALRKLLTKLHLDIDRVFQRALQGKQSESKTTSMCGL